MPKTLKDLFDARWPSQAADSAQNRQHLLQLATAVLLVAERRGTVVNTPLNLRAASMRLAPFPGRPLARWRDATTRDRHMHRH
jgi:hypothetical protein